MTKWIAGLGLGAALAFAAPTTAEAQNNSRQVGLVNVSVGDVVVAPNVAIAVAANIAAQICGTQIALPVNIIGIIVAQVARNEQYTVCTIRDQTAEVPINQDVTITQ
jgi:hypothetical protein